MALSWSDVKGAIASNPQGETALRRWALWLKIENAENLTKTQLLVELHIRGFVKDDLIKLPYC